jgi:hypothetical protein
MPITVYLWEEKQPNGRWRKLNWHMTEEAAADRAKREGRELRKLPWGEETREAIGLKPSGGIARSPGFE